MKKIKEIFLFMVSLVLIFTFLSCSNDDDDDGAETVSVWKATETEDGETVSYTLSFYDDSTFAFYFYLEDFNKGYTAATGTYAGDTTQKSGVVRFIIQKAMESIVYDTESVKLIDCSDLGLYIRAEIDGDRLTFLDANTGKKLDAVLYRQ